MKRFEQEPLSEIAEYLHAQVRDLPPGGALGVQVPDPDLGHGRYGGERFEVGDRPVRHRGYRCWSDLAELLGCALGTPTVCQDAPGFVTLRFVPLDDRDSFHLDDGFEGDATEKYGRGSRFFHIDKLEEPTFLGALTAAFRVVPLAPGARVLDLGINSGDEFELLRRVCGPDDFERLELVGVDHSASAIAAARARFPGPGQVFYEHDINHLNALALGRFDLLVSVGTLHSPGIENSQALLMDLVQHHLTATGSVILGFPNCRWYGGEVTYGARMKNYSHPELSLLLKDVDFCKRYLQQHRFKVTLTGKHYLFVTATRHKEQR